MNPKLLIVGLLMAVMTVYDLMTPAAGSFRTPELAKIMFWHTPSAFISTWFLLHAAYLGLRYFMGRDLKWDVRNGAAIELGALFGVITMATGILFSQVQWGEWWSRDPRQTSFLMVLFLFALGISLRFGFNDDKKRASVSAAYSLLAVLPALFLIFVFPHLPQVERLSLHPSNTIVQDKLDPAYKLGLYGTLTCLALVVGQVYSMRVRGGLLALRLEERHGLDKADSGSPTPTGVVRPVGVSEER